VLAEGRVGCAAYVHCHCFVDAVRRFRNAELPLSEFITFDVHDAGTPNVLYPRHTA
jgi:hypothetical protein